MRKEAKEEGEAKRNSGKTNFKAKVLWHSPVTGGSTVGQTVVVLYRTVGYAELCRQFEKRFV